MSSEIRRLPIGSLLVIILTILLLANACGTAEVASNTVTPSPETPIAGTGTATPTATTQTSTPQSTSTTTEATTPSPSPTPMPTQPPQPADPYAMETLLTREYTGGEIVRESVLNQNEAYTEYLISYVSDGLRIKGVMRIPVGEGRFPVVVMNHGHYEPGSYISGQGTDTMADIVARAGYITLASDYRGHGQSEGEPASFGSRTEYGIDVLNLIASIPSLPEADPSRIGMWGHSMGGEVSMVVSEVNKELKCSVVWAPTSGDAIVNNNYYRRQRGVPDDQIDGNKSAAVSPLYYVENVSAPIQLHQGALDQECDPQWAIRWRDALEAAGKQVEFYWYEDQGHNWREQGWGVIAPRTTEFYDRYLK